MKRNIVAALSGPLLLSALVAFAAIPAWAATDLTPVAGTPAPAVTFKDLAGKTVTLADYRGKVVLVNFWATWCAPCIAEMPAIQQLRDKLGPAGFDVLAVNYREGT